MKKQLPHFCIVLSGNALHAVILFETQKLRKSPAVWSLKLAVWCLLSWATEPLCLSYSCGAVNVTFPSMQLRLYPLLWCIGQIAMNWTGFNLFLTFALTVEIWEPSHWPTVFTKVKQTVLCPLICYHAQCLIIVLQCDIYSFLFVRVSSITSASLLVDNFNNQPMKPPLPY